MDVLLILYGMLFILSLVFLCFRFIEKFLRKPSPLDGHPYANFLVIINGSIFMGMNCGIAYDRLNYDYLLCTVFLFFFFTAISRALHMMFGAKSIKKDIPVALNINLIIIIFTIIVCFYILNTQKENDTLIEKIEFIRIMLPILPLSAFIGAAGKINQLLGPYSLKGVFSPGIDKQMKRILIIMAITSFIPLGGLAIPFWIWVYHRKFKNSY